MTTENIVKTRRDCHKNYVIFERISYTGVGGRRRNGFQITTYAPHRPGGSVKLGHIHPFSKAGKAKANAEFNREVRTFLDIEGCKRKRKKSTWQR